ncbi:hypothetical protein ACFUG9_12385 [Streptomyces griseoincarnatus]
MPPALLGSRAGAWREAMRRAFVRTLGVSPAEYRRRFRPAPALARD